MTDLAEIEEIQRVLQLGDVKKAETLCEALIHKEGEPHAAALHLRGVISLRKGDAADAIQWFHRAEAVGAEDPRFLSNLGEAYRRAGSYDEAKQVLERSLQVDNSITATHFNLAKVYRSIGEARLAEHFLRNVLILDPAKARAHFELADLYRNEGHYREAEFEYRAAIDIASSGESVLRDPSEAERLSAWISNLGSLLRELGATADAIGLQDRAIGLDKGNVKARFERGRCLMELCRENEALRDFHSTGNSSHVNGMLTNDIVVGQIVSANEWCSRRAWDYVELSKAQWLPVPSPKTLPPIAPGIVGSSPPVAPKLYVATLADVTILPFPHALLVEGRALIVDGIVNLPHQFPQTSLNVLHAADDLRVALKIPGATKSLGGHHTFLGSSRDHFGGLYECLGRMWSLEQNSRALKTSYVLGEWVAHALRPLLGLFGLNDECLTELQADSQVHVSNLVVPSLPVIGPWIAPVILQFVRRKLIGAPGGQSRKIFVAGCLRGDHRLTNEGELISLLTTAGVEILYTSEMTLLELIGALQQSCVILSSDIDTLAYLAVAPQGAKVGFIVPEGAVDLRLDFVTQPLGLELTYLIAAPDFKSSEMLAECDFRLEPSILRQYLRSIGEL